MLSSLTPTDSLPLHPFLQLTIDNTVIFVRMFLTRNDAKTAKSGHERLIEAEQKDYILENT